ncbi:MAG: tRNA 2-thiouridine(34) synthase MnmA [Oscillospiraceae bacterium]|nr:tRNA 2-thiouridine(34) synthase MnmA [Oscillospiraceae bacterium]
MEHKKVLVGMSGGVDSAAAALLLREAGYEPVGCTLRLYDNEDIGESAEGTCCSLEAVEDAREACRKLGMDHYTFNFSGQFRRQVMDEFVAAYQSGRTPNPCVQCNRAVKFEALARRADELDIPYIATGHYARADRQGNRWRLLRGADRRKDQSYFLYPLSQRLLCRLLLPVGAYDKPAIRAMAASAGFASAGRPDSQDICFVPDGDYIGFLQRYGGTELVPGDFVDEAGRVLGRHRGLPCYTTGQRRGLGVSADRPLYVLRKDASRNQVVLGGGDRLWSRVVYAEAFQWVSLPAQAGPLPVTAKTRYSQTEASGILYPEADGMVRVAFDSPQRAVTAGQSLVCYQGEAVVGGGIITGAEG